MRKSVRRELPITREVESEENISSHFLNLLCTMQNPLVVNHSAVPNMQILENVFTHYFHYLYNHIFSYR